MISLLAFLVSIIIIVSVHEFGHYAVGLWRGIFPKAFSIGMGPVLWKRTDKRGTEWRISAIPIGGYVQFMGDKDITSVSRDPVESKKRNSFDSATPFSRFLTVLAGPVINFLLSIVIFSAVFMGHGLVKDASLVSELKPSPVSVGLVPGDKLLSVGGEKLDEYGFFMIEEIDPQKEYAWTAVRGGKEITLTAPVKWYVDSVMPRTPADKAGLKSGDVLVAVNGEPVKNGQHVKGFYKDENSVVNLALWRDGKVFDVPLSFKLIDMPENGGFVKVPTTGLTITQLPHFSNPERLSLTEAVQESVARIIGIITLTVSGVVAMITGQMGTCGLSGPVGMAQMSGHFAELGIWQFMIWLGLLSTAIGFTNLLPIPGLDGGHIVFYTVEMITGYKPSERVMRIVLSVGLATILTLMLVGLTADFTC